jgi:hypothetical protein
MNHTGCIERCTTRSQRRPRGHDVIDQNYLTPCGAYTRDKRASHVPSTFFPGEV